MSNTVKVTIGIDDVELDAADAPYVTATIALHDYTGDLGGGCEACDTLAAITGREPAWFATLQDLVERTDRLSQERPTEDPSVRQKHHHEAEDAYQAAVDDLHKHLAEGRA